MKYELKPIKYALNSLEPYIDAKTMEIHHKKHHQAYVNNLNVAIESHPEIDTHYIELLRSKELIPADIKTAVINNGGGVYNHDLFFSILGRGNEVPKGKLLDAIVKNFGSFDNLKTQLSVAAKSRFGSGWAFLVVTKAKKLKVTSTANQDIPFNEGEPILNIDVWEHAYYLSYQNRRPDYIENIFNVINWSKVERLYLEAII